MAAASVVGATAVPATCGLPLRVQGVDVHGEVQLVANDLLVLAGEFVGTVDALGVPVRPVEAVLKHGDGEWVRQALADDGLAVASIQVRPLDDMVLRVHPVHAVAGVVDGEAVGPEQVCVCDDLPVGAVHVRVLDARCVAPVCPVDLTLYGVQRDGSGLLHVLPQQHLAVRPVQVGYLDTGRPRVCPVQLVMDPVYGQSTWTLQTGGNNLLHVGAVEVGLHDAVQRHVGPEDQLVAVVEVQGDGVLQVVEQQGVLGAMRQNLTDVDAVSEQQHRFWTQSFAAALVRSELVALNAPAQEPPLRVGTALAAVAFLSTLVHILAGFAVIHQSVSSVTGALDQSSDHLTLLGTVSVILVTVALAGAWTTVVVWVFVSPVSTVVDLIAHLPLTDTASIPTLELIGSTRWTLSFLTTLFIAAVGAVGLAITSPGQADAASSTAAELLSRAHGRGAVLLV